ncbi:MAG: protein kinase [Chloroflexota bacterium]
MSHIPQQIGNYNLERRLGKGGTSEVWLAEHRSLTERTVAIKLLLSQDTEWIERFTREANLISHLHHKHIVQIYDHGYEAPFYYTVMEYIAGGSLRDLLKKKQQLSFDQALWILRGVGAALDYAHIQGVIHRDISPGNILIEQKSSRVLLTDFGIAREAGRSSVTAINKVMGTPGYLSPEHALSATAVTRISDIYSLGIVFFEMLSGRLPWDHYPGIADTNGGQFTTPKLLRDCGVEGLPADIDRIIQNMLALEPSKRYPSVEATLQDLERSLQRHTNPTQVVISSKDNPKQANRNNIAFGTTVPNTSRSEPLTIHPVETVLGPDLLKSPLQQARKHAESLLDHHEIATILNQWSIQGFFRRKLLGRQIRVHRVTTTNIYFYTLNILYETREPARLVEKPDYRATSVPLEKELDRWSVKLPAPQGFGNETGNTITIPGTTRVLNCKICHGLGKIKCTTCNGSGRIKRTTTTHNQAPAKTIMSASEKPMPSFHEAHTIKSATRLPGSTTTVHSPVIAACSECEGTGSMRCQTCDGVGRLIQHKTTTWTRHSTVLTAQDDLPNINEVWLRKTCDLSEIYREQHSGIRTDWQSIPQLAHLFDNAKLSTDENTHIRLSEVTISFVPITEILFDLSDSTFTVMDTTNTQSDRDTHLYSWHIYGFEKQLPHDSRFLNWERILMVAFGTTVVVLLTVIFIIVR